ncbi:MAG: VOC family protein [Pseudomonadota bacterium]
MTPFVTHIALYCQDLDKTVDWYKKVFHVKTIANSPGRFAALSFGEKHHDFALVQRPEGFGPPVIEKAGLYHFAIDTGSFDNSMRIYGRALEQMGDAEKAIDHRVGTGIYIRDPDLNLVELWSEHYPTYAQAIASIPEMDPPFEENPIGFPLNASEIYEKWLSENAD